MPIFLLGKGFEKQTETTENEDKRQIEAIEDHRKQLTKSNEPIKNVFNIDRYSIPLDEKYVYI